MRRVRRALVVAVLLVFTAPLVSSAAAPQRQTTETAAQFYLRWRSTARTAQSADEIHAAIASALCRVRAA